MIDRFNFYDVYGYFIPGATLLALLWLPFAIIGVGAPDAELVSALVGAIVAYVLGHLLKTLTTPAFDTRRKMDGEPRYPSDYLFDELAPAVRERLGRDVQGRFGLEMELREGRTEGFYLCRSLLLDRGKGRYFEQFQGMYELQRGVAGAAVLAAGYFAGWIAGSFLERSSLIPSIGALVAIGFLVVWICLLDRVPGRSLALWLVAGIMLLVGLLASSVHEPEFGDWQRGALVLALLGSCLLARRTYTAFRRFTEHFARAVYRSYMVAVSEPEQPPHPAEEG